MYIQRSNKSGTLSAVVIERQQLESSIVLGAQVALDLIFITECLKTATGHQELLGLLLHTVLSEQVAEDLKVAGLIGTSVFRDLAEVGEGAPLALLMGNDRTLVGHAVLIVPGELNLTIIVVIGMGSTTVPVETTGPTLHMILRAVVPGPATANRGPTIEPRRIITLHGLHPVVAVGHPVAGRLIARSHHDKRGMMTVGIDDAFRLLQQILVDLLSATELYTVIRPRRTFGLQIDTQFIGSSKGSLGRTIGMEPHMVQTILLDLRENTDPRGLIRGGITRLGETTVLHRTAQPHGVVVDIQLSAFYPHLAQAEGGLVIVIAHSDTDLIELGGELIPQTEHLPDGDTHGDGIAGNLQIVHQTDAILISQRHDCHRHILIVVQGIVVTIQQHGDMYLIVHRLWTDLHLFDAHPLRLGP